MSQVKASERQKQFEDKCREIADELVKQVSLLPLPNRILAKANIADLFDCIRTAYGNGRADEKENVPVVLQGSH